MRATNLSGCEVVDESGQVLGRLVDIRLGREGDALPSVVTAIVFGKAGWLERFGFRGVRTEICPWSRVRSVTRRRIVLASRRGAANAK